MTSGPENGAGRRLFFKIVDRRSESQSLEVERMLWLVCEALGPKPFVGIRTVHLFDTDYLGRDASGRYVPVKGTGMGDIEMFFSHYLELDSRLLDSPVYLQFLVTSTLMHEVYHHMVRQRKIFRKKGRETEEREASEWALKVTKLVLRRTFPESEYGEEFVRIREVQREIESEDE